MNRSLVQRWTKGVQMDVQCRYYIQFLLCFVLLCFIIGLGAVTDKRISIEKWSEDLDEMIRRMEFIHPDLYVNTKKETIYNEIESLKAMMIDKTDTEMVLELMKLLAHFKDGHTMVDPVLTSDKWVIESFHQYPFRVYKFSDGWYITNTSKDYQQLVGKKLIKIGDYEVAKAETLLSQYISADNQYGVMNKLPILLSIKEILEYERIKPMDRSLSLQLTDENGLISEVKIEDMPLPECYPELFKSEFPAKDSSLEVLPLWLKNVSENYYYTVLPGEKTIYLQINSMQEKKDEKFSQFCERMFREIDKKKINKLIIDLRLNIGGQHFEMPLLKGIMAREKINRMGGLFVITGRVTFSASQHLTTQLSRYTNVVIVGEPTSGKPNHYGTPKTFKLLNSGVGIKCSYVFHQDNGPEDFSLSTYPDVIAEISWKDYSENRDPAMDRIQNYELFQKFKTECYQQLIKAYEEKGFESFKSKYLELKPKCLAKGINIEKFLYDDLDGWIVSHRKSADDYILYLRFILEENPASIRIRMDLASWMKTRDKAEALKLYNDCLKINPACKSAGYELFLSESTKTEIKGDTLKTQTEVKGPGTYKILNNSKFPIRIPMEMHNGKPRMALEINGKKAFLMIDNGIMWDEVWLLGSPLVKEIGLKSEEQVQVGGSGSGEMTKAFTSQNLTLKFSDIIFYDQPVIVSDESEGFTAAFPGTDGQLCNTFFKHFIVEFDFVSMNILLHKPEEYKVAEKCVILDMKLEPNGHHSVPVTVVMNDGKEYKYRTDIDFGEINLMRLALNNAFNFKVPANAVQVKSYGVQGEMIDYETTIREIRFGEMVIKNPKVVFTDVQYSSIYPENLGVIGQPCFMQFNTAFDYINNKIYLSQPKNKK